MNDPVDRLLMERARADSGYRSGVVASLVAHLVTLGAAFAAPFLFPPPPPLKVADGFAVVLPRGGGGDPNAGGNPAPPPAVQTPPPAEPAPPAAVEPPPKVLKPPKDEPRKGLPDVDARKAPKKADKPTSRAPDRNPADVRSNPAATGSSRGPGTSSGPQGLTIGPAGPGVPDGTDSGGDWYLAGVQQKIWTIWTQQINAGFSQFIGVTFSILADGNVADLEVTQSSGNAMLDMAARRAVLSAAPFAPLPKEYGTNRYTIRAIFKPAQ